MVKLRPDLRLAKWELLAPSDVSTAKASSSIFMPTTTMGNPPLTHWRPLSMSWSWPPTEQIGLVLFYDGPNLNPPDGLYEFPCNLLPNHFLMYLYRRQPYVAICCDTHEPDDELLSLTWRGPGLTE